MTLTTIENTRLVAKSKIINIFGTGESRIIRLSRVFLFFVYIEYGAYKIESYPLFAVKRGFLKKPKSMLPFILRASYSESL